MSSLGWFAGISEGRPPYWREAVYGENRANLGGIFYIRGGRFGLKQGREGLECDPSAVRQKETGSDGTEFFLPHFFSCYYHTRKSPLPPLQKGERKSQGGFQ